MNLYELTAAQHVLQAQLEAAGFDDQTIADTLEGEENSSMLLEKRLGYIAIIKSKRALAEARAAAANDMAALAEAEAKDAGRLEAALLASMSATGDSQLVGLQFEAKIRKNPPAIEVLDSAALPLNYWRTPEPKPPVAAPDKALIKADLQAGKEVPGAKLTQSLKLVIK
jgi:hypothetical protein